MHGRRGDSEPRVRAWRPGLTAVRADPPVWCWLWCWRVCAWCPGLKPCAESHGVNLISGECAWRPGLTAVRADFKSIGEHVHVGPCGVLRRRPSMRMLCNRFGSVKECQSRSPDSALIHQSSRSPRLPSVRLYTVVWVWGGCSASGRRVVSYGVGVRLSCVRHGVGERED